MSSKVKTSKSTKNGSAKSRKKPETTNSSSSIVDQLPNDILHEIFNFLSFEDRQECSLVCQKWLKIITESRQLCGALNINHCIISEVTEPWKLLKNSTRKFPHVKIGDCVTPGSKQARVTQFANLIKGVETLSVTNGKNAMKMFNWLIPVYENLMELEVPSMEELFELDLIPETVKTIIITTGRMHLTQSEIDKINSMKNLKNLGITWIEFPTKNKSKFPVEFIKVPDYKGKSSGIPFEPKIKVSRTVNFMENPSIELRNIEEFAANFTQKELKKSLPHLKNLKSLKVHSEENCFFVHKLVNVLSVTEFDVVDTEETVDDMCKRCVKNVYDSFPNLTILGFHGLNDENIRKMLSIKHKTLNVIRKIKIETGLETYEEEPFSFKAFPVLKNVKHLELIEFSTSQKEILQLMKKFPKLVSLKLVRCGLKRKLIKLMCDGLSELKLLEIENRETQDNDDYDQDAVKDVDKNWIAENIDEEILVKVACGSCQQMQSYI